MRDDLIIGRRARVFSWLELLLIFSLALFPLLLSFPYRVNIFLSWEGAYRISQGQVPFRDFGMPLGYMYWVIPAAFFKIFGVQMITLVKAQAFINILSGLAFRSILKSFGLPSGLRLLSVFVYVISFSFFNFWPWYNHTVIVYQMISLAFLARYCFGARYNLLFLVLSAVFAFFSFFTKQDAGGMAFVLVLVLLAYDCLLRRNWKPLLVFIGAFAATALLIILPLLQYNFSYWFNHGQAPHTSRVSAFDIVDEFLYSTQALKFYLLLIALLLVARGSGLKELLSDRRNGLFLLLTLGILGEAAVLQVTSYTPPDNNIFYHSFAFAFLLYYGNGFLKINYNQTRNLLLFAALILLWWSGSVWKYVQGPVSGMLASAPKEEPNGENMVNRKTYILSTPTGEIPMDRWKTSNIEVFRGIRMPGPTIEGLERLLQMPQLRGGSEQRILNMTELTPLAHAVPFSLEKGPQVPLWHHLGVSMFNKEASAYEEKIRAQHYDLVLFEYIPRLNNFYPFRVRDTLQRHYQKIDSFAAPRRGETQGVIEIYKKALQ